MVLQGWTDVVIQLASVMRNLHQPTSCKRCNKCLRQTEDLRKTMGDELRTTAVALHLDSNAK
jgi:hypothetical protein